MKKRLIFCLFFIILLSSITFADSPNKNKLEKGDIIARSIFGTKRIHTGIYIGVKFEKDPHNELNHEIAEMLSTGVNKETNNLMRFKFDDPPYKGARRKPLTNFQRNKIVFFATESWIQNLPYIDILLVGTHVIDWNDFDNDGKISSPENGGLAEIIGIRSDGWVELVYAFAGIQIWSKANIIYAPNYFNFRYNPNIQFYDNLSEPKGECPKITIKDFEGNEVKDGDIINNNEISVDATDEILGSGIHCLEIWDGYPDYFSSDYIKTVYVTKIEDSNDPIGHNFKASKIEILPEGEIYIRVYDQAGNYATKKFTIDLDSDDDGISDGDEDQNGNGIVDEGETDPNNPDSDGDSLSDGEEVNEYSTDPLNKDTDGDNYFDGLEVNILKSDPLNPLDPDPKEKAILFVNPSSLSIKKGKTATSKIWVENLYYGNITGNFKTERRNDPNGIVLMSQPPTSAVSYKNWKKYKWNEVPKYNLTCMNCSTKPGEHAIYSVKFTNIRFGSKEGIDIHKSNKDNENNSSDEPKSQERMGMFCGNNTDDPPDVPDENDFFDDDVDEPESTLLNLLTKTTDISYNDKNLIYGFDSNYGVCKAEILHDRDADIGVFLQGKFTANGKLLRKYLETINLLDIFTKEVIFFKDKKFSDHNLLILPTGSLMGIENDIELKYELEKYVEDGGVLVCFSQQHGYEFTALPGGEVSGKGWREDQACHTYSVYVEEYHPVLSNLRNSVVNCNVDGYFTSYPDNSKILLRRTKNGYPAMILYPYGDGYVIASTLYTDWSYDKVTLLHEAPTLSREETNIYRDVISWSVKKNRENIPEFKQGDDVTFSVDILGTKYNMYASTAVIQIFNPDRDLQDIFTYPISLQEGNTVSIPINYNTNYPFGIWWVTYHLLNEDGIRITEEIRSNRFVLSNPPETYTPDENIQIWVTSPFETAFKGSEIPFEIHIKNNHNYDLVDYTLAIALWQLKESLIVTIPANSEITVNWTEPRFNAANMYWFGLYKPGVSYNYFCKNALVRTRRMVYESYPGADAEIQLSKEIILPNEDFDITVDIKNLNAVDYDAAIELRVLDSQNFPVYFEERDITLLSQQGLSEVFNVVLSSDINRGKCFVRAEIIRDGIKIGGAIKGFDVPDLDLFFIPVYPDPIVFNQNNTVRIKLDNKSGDDLEDGILSVKLYSPDNTILFEEDRNILSIPQGNSIFADFNIPFNLQQFGEYRLETNYTDLNNRNARGIDKIDNSNNLLVTLDKTSYKSGEDINVNWTITNKGKFKEDFILRFKVPVIDYQYDENITLNPGQTLSNILSIPIPIPNEIIPYIIHSLQVIQVVDNDVTKAYQFTVPDSEFTASVAGNTFNAGDPIPVTLENTGGVSGKYSLIVTLNDNKGNIVDYIEELGSLNPASQQYNLNIPTQIISGEYIVNILIQNTSNLEQFIDSVPVNINGVAGDFNIFTDKPVYAKADSIEVNSQFTNSGVDINNAELRMKIVTGKGRGEKLWNTYEDFNNAVNKEYIDITQTGEVLLRKDYEFEGKWGTGTDDFTNPMAAAYDSNGNMLILNIRDAQDKILKYDSNGEFISSFLQIGKIDEKIYIDQYNRIYLITPTSYITKDVKVFSPEGDHITTLPELTKPQHIAIDTNSDTNTVYVYDSGDRYIHVYDSNLTFQRSFDYKYTSYNVYDMKISNDGNLLLLTDEGYLLNYCHIVKLDLNGNKIYKKEFIEHVHLRNFIEDMNDNIHVVINAKGANNKGFIIKLDSDINTDITQTSTIPISTTPIRNGESNGARFWIGTNLTRDKIILVDHSSYKVDEYDLDYNLVNDFFAWPGRKYGFHGLKGMKFDSQGNYWLVDELNKRVAKYDIDGNFILDIGHYYTGQSEKYFRSPYGIDIDSANNIYVIDKGAGSYTAFTGIKKYDSNGNFIEKLGGYSNAYNIAPGKFYHPTGIAIDNNDKVYVADWGHHRIQKYDPDSGTWTIIDSSIGGSLLNPIRIDFDSDNKMYVADEGNERIVIFENDISEEEWTFVGKKPFDLKIDKDDNIYVGFKHSSGSLLVYKYNKNKEKVAEFCSSNECWDGTGFGFHPDGRVFMATGDRVKIYKFRYPLLGGEITLRYDSGINGAQWENISWSAIIPEGTALIIKTRTADAEGDLVSSVWSGSYTNAGDSITSSPGRYIDVFVGFESDNSYSLSPVLYQLDVSYDAGVQELWSNTYNNSIPSGGNWNINENIGSLDYLGQLYLKGELISSDNQVIGEKIYPFSITDRELGISFDTNKDIYKPGETINISGDISNLSTVSKTGIVVEFKKDEEVFYTETFTVPAESTITFSTITSSTYPITITGRVFESAKGPELNEFIVSKQIDVQEPVVEMTVQVPEIVGRDIFEYIIKVKNAGLVDVDETLNVGTNSEVFSLEPGVLKIFKYQYSITEDSEITAALSGDVSVTKTNLVQFGENADINISYPGTLAEGFCEIPVSISNTGTIDEILQVTYTLLDSGDNVLETRVKEYSISVGNNINEIIVYQLQPGQYKLKAECIYDSLEVDFFVSGPDNVILSTEVLEQSNGIFPLNISLTNNGYNDFSGYVRVTSVFTNTRKQFEVLKGNVVTIHIPLNPETIPAGVYPVKVELLNTKGELLSETEESIEITEPDFIVISKPENPSYSAGSSNTVTFTVQNQGSKEGELSFNVKVMDILDNTQKVFLDAGAAYEFTYNLNFFDDMPDGDYRIEYTVNGKIDYIPFTLAGIKIQVSKSIDSNIYEPGDTITLTVNVTNKNTDISPVLIEQVKYAGYDETREFTLNDSKQLQFEFAAVSGNNKVEINIFEKDGRSQYIAYEYIRIWGEDIILYTDKNIYDPGETVQVFIVTRSTGTLTIKAPGGFIYEQELEEGSYQTSFDLPAEVIQDTYYINYEFNSIPYLYPFDIRGIDIKIVECVLDKVKYYNTETIHARYTVQSNKNIDTLLRGWIRFPDRRDIDAFSMPVSLVEGYNYIDVYTVFNSTFSGIHRLLYSFTDLLEEQVYAAAIETFNAGKGQILDFDTDKDVYPSLDEIVNVQIVLTGDGDLTLEIKEGDTVLYNQPVSLDGEMNLTIPLSGFSFGEHTLTASLKDADTINSKETFFQYGSGIPDLKPTQPFARRHNEKEYKLSSFIRNMGDLPANNVTVRYIIEKEGMLSRIIYAENISLIEGGNYIESSIIVTNLDYGEYSVIVEIDWDNLIVEKDENNNLASSTFISTDELSPSITVLSPEDDQWYKGSMDITAQVTDNYSGIDKVEYIIDAVSTSSYDIDTPALMIQVSGDTLTGVFLNSIDTTILDDGFYFVNISAFDKNDNGPDKEYEDLNPIDVFFKVDNSVPEINIGFDTFSIEINNVTYILEETNIYLFGYDEFSGLDWIKYKVDEGSWSNYNTEPFTLAGYSDGEYIISYYGTDNIGNQSDINTKAVTLDSTDPSTLIVIGEPKEVINGNIYVGYETPFTFNAIDSGCGVSNIQYRINGGDWQIYDGAFNLEGLEEIEVAIEYFSTDRLGNDEEVQSVTVFINADNTPPETSMSIGEPKYVDGDNVYVTGVTEFTLIATDDVSGVKKIEYRIDSGSWVEYFNLFTLSGLGDGSHTIGFRSIDNANNQEEEKSITVIVDNTKPVSNISIGTPKYISGNSKYVTSNTPFTISAVENGSGLNKTLYKVDSTSAASQWIEYNATFILSGYGEGQYTISYRSTDNLGNTEQVKTITVIVDDSSPETSIAYAPSREDNEIIYVIKGTEFTLNAVDKPVLHSGVQRTEYMIVNSSGVNTGWLNYLNPFNLAMYDYGEYIISYRSYDNLGNVEQEKSIIVQLSEEFEGSIDLSTASSVLIWLNQKPEDITSEKLERLTQILDESGLLMYNITTNHEDFVNGFRSSLYNTYIILGNHKNLERHWSLEMREHVFAGRGLISSKYYHFNGEGNKPEALGIVYHGSYPVMPIMVSLDDSPVSTGGIITVEELVYKAELNPESDSTGYGTISVAPHDPTPAVVLNNYGKGKAVYLPFDLFLNLTDDNLAKLTELLKGSIEYVKPQEVQIIPGGIIPLQIRVKSLVVPLTVKVTEEVPGGVEIVQVFQEGDVDNNSIIWQFDLAYNQEKNLHFIVKLPDTVDIYTFITTIDYLVSGLWYNYVQFTKDIELTGTTEDIKQTILEELNNLTPESHQDQNHIDNVIKKIERLDLNSITTPEQKEHAILTLIQAIETLKKVEGVEIMNIKLSMIKLIILVEIMEV